MQSKQPEALYMFIKWAEDNIGPIYKMGKSTHGDRSDVYKLTTANALYYLKIGKNLQDEKVRIEWAQGKVPTPQVVAFTEKSGLEALITTALPGENLAELSKKWQPEKVVDSVVSALHALHNIDISGSPFGEPKLGKVLVHGDASLPNLIYDGDAFSGFIDLGEMSVGDKDIDLSAAVWSLEYNLGKGYGAMFLKKYGVENVTEEMVEHLSAKYEENWPRWFPEEYS